MCCAISRARSSAWPLGHDFLGQADQLCAVGVDLHAGLDQPQGVAHAHDAGQALGAAVGQGKAPALVEQAEAGVVGHDPEIAPARQFHAAGQTPAVDGGDRGLARVQQGEAHRPGGVGVGVLPELAHALQIRARAEGLIARPGDRPPR